MCLAFEEHTPANKKINIKNTYQGSKFLLPENSKLVTATSTKGIVRSSLASSGQLAKKQTNKEVKTLVKCTVPGTVLYLK